MNRQAYSPFRYLFLLFAAAQGQFNFGQHYLNYTFQGEPPKCPDLHVYVVGLSPHNCVSYRSECQGVTSAQIVKLTEGQSIFCHPNFQPNLRNPFIFRNLSVDPFQPITLRIDEYDQTKLYYINNIQLKNCYIVFAYKNSLNQESNHCLFYRKQYILPNFPCSCSAGFFDDPITLTCIVCHLNCLTCSGSEINQCTSCKPLANREFKNNQCICKSRYFELNVEQCSSCSQECLECSLQFDRCTSCQKGKQLIGNKCFCETKLNGVPFSTYKPSGSIDCIRCHYSCLSCNASAYDKCQTCYGIENRYQSGSTCSCQDGYYDPGAPICQKCGYQCQTCIYSENQCLSCQLNSLRTLSAQIFSCSCNQGYFDDGQNPKCQKCDYRCGQCSIRFDHCIACSEGTFRYFNEILFTCDCMTGFFDGRDDTCKPCHYSCLECTGQQSAQCRSCDNMNPLSKRVLFYTQCVCLKGYYDDGVSANCQQCDISCLECETYAYSCISCSTTRTLNNNSCKCKSGYFETGQKECLICNNNCLQCRSTAKTCTECNIALFLALDVVTNVCICKTGYMEVNGLCQMCTKPCQTCFLQLDHCTSCSENRYLSNDQCLCLDGFFDFQGYCQICHKSCLTCKNSETFCLTCSSQNFRKLTIQNTCECLEGYYEQVSTLSCEKCDFSCKTCTFKAKNCTSCHTTLHFDIYLNTCLCQQGYYLDQGTYTCLQCHVSCLTCDSIDKCTSCRVKTRTLDDQLKTCDCQERFFDTNQAECLKCNYSCSTCTISENNCKSCNPILNRNLIGNKCQCIDGYYDAGTQLCFACGSKCKTCVDKLSKCTLCYETQNRSLKVNTCECQDGYFDSGDDNCQKCSIKCKTCTGFADYCTSCDINLQRFDQSAIHKCPCYTGFYENEIGQCQKCNIKCESCINTQDNCLSCNNPQKNNRQSLSSQCNCKNGYYDDNILECQKCSKICGTCITNATNCISCYGNLRYNPPNCPCLDGYYEDTDQNCLQCQNQCSTCILSENNCLICKHGRINQACECPKGYFEAGLIECIKCEFQCFECIQYSTQCTTCRGNRVNPHNCTCEDGYYDDSLNDDCQQCDFRCKTCNIQGCLTCNGNRILSNEQTCDPPDNSISYEITPWCSNCEVAVLSIRFSDDLNSILVKFDFQLKALQEIQYCNQILEDDTLNKIGIGYSCNMDKLDNSILIIFLGQQSTIIVDDQIKLKLNILQHIDCQLKLSTFVFNIVQHPLNILEPIIKFNVPNYQISSCSENIITSDYTDIDGKRRFSQIKWSYQILNQEKRQEIDDLIQNFNTNQDTDIVIPAQTLPDNAQITFQIQITNFIGTTSTIAFDLNTLSPSQPVIQVDVKNSYFNYQTIIINYSIHFLDCNNKNVVQSLKVSINLVEINKSNKTAASSNINLSYYSEESEHLVTIPKYQLTPKTTYYFKLNATDVQTLQSSEIFFNFLIKPADILCQFIGALNVQDFRKDLNFYIQCKDSNANYDWNQDPSLEIEVTCNDLTTQGPCMNQQKKKLVISQYSYEQAVPKYSVKPYTVQSWQVFAKKEATIKKFEQIVVFVEDSFVSLEIIHNPAYNVRSVNNYEQLNFTYQIPLDQRVNVVEMSLSIICDFSVIKVLQPKFYQFQIQLQNYINDAQKGISLYNLKFSVQYSTSITPSIYNLPLTLNIPPICSKFKQIQSNVDIEGITKIDIMSYCAKSDDSPYQYKVGYFLTEQDQIDFLNGNSKLILGSQVYQKSPKLSTILPNSFYNNSIFILVSIMDSGGSITNQFEQSKLEKRLNCSQQNKTQLNSLDILIPTLFQALGQPNCSSFQQYIYQQILMKGDLSNEDFFSQKKAIRIYKNQSKQQQSKQLRILDEQAFNLCIDPASKNYIINYSLNNNTNLTLDEVIKDNKGFDKTITLLTKLYNQSKADLKDLDLEWDQNLFDEYLEAIQSLKFSLFDADNILVKLSFLNEIDEQGYQIFNNLLFKIDQITKLIQDQVIVNESPEILDGEVLHWKLQRQTKQKFNEMLGKSTIQDDEIIKFMQKEYLELTLSPYKFTNSMKQTISNLLNSTNFLIDPTKMIQTKLYIFHFNDQLLLQMNSSSKLQYQMKQLQNCSNDSSNTETKNYSPVCFVVQGKQIVENCIVQVQYQQLHTNLNCICSSFGQVILLYKETQLNSSSINESTTATTEQTFTFSFENISFQSLIVIFLITYNCLVITMYLYLILSKKQPFDLKSLEQSVDKMDEQIQLYPGNHQVLKQCFKFVHQLSSLFCFNDSIIQKSFYFIDMNVQFCIMLLPLCLFNIDFGQYEIYIEILILVLNGLIFRMVSKILQGFYRLNKLFRIVIGITQIMLFLGINFLLIILQAGISEEKIISKLFDLFVGIIFWEVAIEPLLIISSVQSYKMAYSSIKFKEFKIINHLIYYFAFHERLEEIFKQYTYI